MMFSKRIWSVANVPNEAELAEKLVQGTWTLCTAFELSGYLFLNDSTCEDAAQEYAVVKKPTHSDNRYLQVESITFSWLSEQAAYNHIVDCVKGNCDSGAVEVHPRLQPAADHGTCRLCQ